MKLISPLPGFPSSAEITIVLPDFLSAIIPSGLEPTDTKASFIGALGLLRLRMRTLFARSMEIAA